MITRYQSCPEIIGSIERVDKEGDTSPLGDYVVGVSIDRKAADALIEIRQFKGGCLMIRLQLSGLVAAISHATLNAEVGVA